MGKVEGPTRRRMEASCRRDAPWRRCRRSVWGEMESMEEGVEEVDDRMGWKLLSTKYFLSSLLAGIIFI